MSDLKQILNVWKTTSYIMIFLLDRVKKANYMHYSDHISVTDHIETT